MGTQNRACVLGAESGKLNIVVRRWQQIRFMSSGAHILADVTRTAGSTRIVLDNITLLSTPMNMRHDALAWLHMLLELCFYFLPLEKPASSVYRILLHAESVAKAEHFETAAEMEFVQNSFVVSLMAHLGFYPEEHLEPLLKFGNSPPHRIPSPDGPVPNVDSTNEPAVEFLQTAADRYGALCSHVGPWVISCLQHYPQFNFLRATWNNYATPPNTKAPPWKQPE
jgi:hypothetical protein